MFLISDIQLPNKPLLQWKWSQTLHLTKMQILLKSSLQTPSGLNLIEHFKDVSEKNDLHKDLDLPHLRVLSVNFKNTGSCGLTRKDHYNAEL